MHPRELSILDFTYDLPAERIARYPLEERDQSKLLVWDNGHIRENIYRNLADELPEQSLLVFNNTRVVEARLLFQKETGGLIEIFCLEPGEQYTDITTAMLQKEKVIWKCLVGGAKKWKEGTLTCHIANTGRELILSAAKLEKRNDYYLIELRWNEVTLSFAEVLHLAGSIPLPPYLERDVEENDKDRYQTIYAKHDGSVAAPTAGLHFTGKVFTTLDNRHIQKDFVTLHVGAGTFKPVKAVSMEHHEMHAEFIDVRRECIHAIIEHLSTKIIAVGTTSLRTLESVYWLGCKLVNDPGILPESLQLDQWEAYDADQGIDTGTALHALLSWMDRHGINRLLSKTQIIIAPGYRFHVISGLITNFHQPQSTLLLLVAAITGKDWKTIYEYALSHDFRFLSYGDGSLLWLS